MIETITWKIKGKAKERPKDVQPASIKERRELGPFMVGSYIIQSPSNVAYMQTMKSK
jgi:hypothetical protein